MIGLFAAMLALVVLLAACGNGGGGGAGGGGAGVNPSLINNSIMGTYAFLAEEINLPDLETRVQGSIARGDRIYFYYVEVDNPGPDTDWETWEPSPPTLVIASMRIDGSDLRRTEIPAEGNSSNIAGFHITNEGNFGLLIVEQDWSMQRGSSTTLIYAEYDIDGRQLVSEEITGVVPPTADWFSVDRVFFAADGNMVLAAWADRGSELFLLNSARQVVGRLDIDWARGIVELGDGRVVVATSDFEETTSTLRELLRVIDFEAGDWGETYEITVAGARNLFPAGSEDPFDLIIDDGNHLFGYNMATGERMFILNWIEAGLAAQWDYHVGFLDNGSISVLVSDWDSQRDGWRTELMTLNRVSRDTLPERVTITVGGLWFSGEVRQQIVAFNRNNLTHQIQVRDYGMYNTPDDWDAGGMRMLAELAAGMGPDIIWGGGLDAFADRGLFADLYRFIDADPTISRADFFPNILRAMESPDGSLPMIANSFGLQTMIGTAEHVGHIESWTMAEMLALIEAANPQQLATLMGDWMTGESFLSMALWFGGDFLDWEARRANLDSAEFIALLNIAARLPDEHGWEERQMGGGQTLVSGHVWESEFARMLRGDQLISMAHLWDARRYQEFVVALGDVVALGVPTADGGAHVIHPGQGFGINAASPRQNEAWDFVRQFLLPTARIEWDFPIRVDLFDAQLQEAMTPQTLTSLGWPIGPDDDPNEEISMRSVWIDDMRQIPMYAMTQAEADGLRAIVESASVVGHFHVTVWELVQEELLPFFAGDRTAENTARIINNRVQTFMNEQR